MLAGFAGHPWVLLMILGKAVMAADWHFETDAQDQEHQLAEGLKKKAQYVAKLETLGGR